MRGDVLWEVKGIVDGVKCDPHGVIYLPAPRDILLVCDGGNTRLLVLDPSTGNHRQSISLPETMGEVQDLCYHNNDELVVLHNVDNLFQYLLLFNDVNDVDDRSCDHFFEGHVITMFLYNYIMTPAYPELSKKQPKQQKLNYHKTLNENALLDKGMSLSHYAN